jgi:hypothetical protein
MVERLNLEKEEKWNVGQQWLKHLQELEKTS